ncbi:MULTISPECIES: prohead protease/major capsid protein fusion protein [Pseudomonas chlororaphis group]|uniref:prohead protease/major capsid protein fusion protein n=1 Tax=Pseudomonas chlororaphis group TaxID=136842 RepID=UPI002097DBCE|nr:MULTISPECIES: prohead protease/major capsid protein fusion protein [Pseudomonas chlororaphis group]MCO7576176.1 Mu-like prophage major head subunit gpT family protein [Pseudomonas protegens]MCO7580986.1 Mu-like prophage major head subunit gpT family protein [Pseudomonas chlororaphis]MCO7597989.1 Mu-like prophage major head subunit gpT family protein [Pseudomonas chlororaphis]
MPTPKQATTNKTHDTPTLSLRAAVREGSVDIEARTVELVWTTGAIGQRWSWDVGTYMEELEVSEEAIRLERLNNGAPLLNTHKSDDLDDVIGVVERAWIEGGEGHALVRFSKRDDAEKIFLDVQDKILRKISVRYAVHRYQITEDSEDKHPTYRAVDWEPLELSIVPIAFDDGANIRSAKTPAEYTGERFKTIFEVREAKTLPDQPAAVANTTEENPMTEEEKRAAEELIRKQAEETERKRSLTIRQMARKVGLGDDVADDLIARGVSLSDASSALIDKVAERQAGDQPETRNSQATVTGGVDTAVLVAKRSAMINALDHRCSPNTIKLEEPAREFRGMRLVDMARECVEMVGGNTRGLMPAEIAKAALGCDRQAMRSAGMHSTSDFPLLLGNTVNRTLRAAYEVAPQTWRPLGRQTTVPDFRAVTRAALGDIAALEQIKEHGEYQYGTLEEDGAPIKVAKFGKIIAITWEAIVNDDLGAFTRVPQALGNAAAQTESDVVWSLLLGNPNYTDGTPIFHANHGNLAAGGGAINTTTLAAARAAMRKQKTKAGAFLNLAPEFLVVGPDKELEAYQFTSSNYVPAKNSDINDSRNAALTVIVDARITGNQWYLYASPGVVDTFEYAYLEGEQGVFTETREGFEVDGMEIKARLVFGAGWIDYRAGYKNPGA